MNPVRSASVALVAGGSLLLSGCVGPATTDAAYSGKAVHATDAAESAVQTAVLTTNLLLRGRIFGSYADVVLSTVEQDVSSVQNSFDSIQPPDDAVSDKLRNGVDALLTSGASDLTDLRIAARRGDTKQMGSLLAELRKLAPKLDSFSKEHGG